MGIANSKLISFYGNIKLPNFGKQIFPKLNPQDIKLLPIINVADERRKKIIDKADFMLSKNNEFHQLKQNLLHLLHTKHEDITISKKLLDWPSLSFNELLKELQKQKIKLALSEQSEWLHYFETERKKVAQLQDVIERTDKEIDRMVYALYGLTDEEIQLVEDNT